MKKTSLAVLAAAVSIAAILSGCDDETKTDKQTQGDTKPKTEASTPASDQKATKTGSKEFDDLTSNEKPIDPNRALTEALERKPVLGAKLSANPNYLTFDTEAGGRAEHVVRIVNDGDVKSRLNSLTITDAQSGVTLSGPCMTDQQILDPGKSCDLTVTFEDHGTQARQVDTGLLITSDAAKTPQVQVALAIKVKPAPPPPPAWVSNPTKEAPGLNYGQQQEIARANDLRRAGGFGHAQGFDTNAENTLPPGVTPEVSYRQRENRYDPSAFPAVQTSLPVDRSRILTSDRRVKVILITPIRNVLCGKILAQSSGPVWASEGTNILIPARTIFEGHCERFVDERVGLVWTQFTTPDGRRARIDTDSADMMGRGGVPGNLDRRLGERFGVPLVFSALRDSIGAFVGGTQTSTVSSLGSATQSESAKSKAIDQFISDTQSLNDKFSKELTDVTPILDVAAGTRLDVVFNEDIYFKSPYEVVKLADVEYGVQPASSPPLLIQTSAPSYGLEPALGTGGIVTLNGQSYRLVADPTPQRK